MVSSKAPADLRERCESLSVERLLLAAPAQSAIAGHPAVEVPDLDASKAGLVELGGQQRRQGLVVAEHEDLLAGVAAGDQPDSGQKHGRLARAGDAEDDVVPRAQRPSRLLLLCVEHLQGHGPRQQRLT
jgi:hypothetical protein